MKNKINKDYMTGLYNRRYFFEVGKKIYEENKKLNKTISIAILDIDKFKKINDTYGHSIGDFAIKEVARVLTENIMSSTLISRIGGEEFCLLFYNRDKEEIEQKLRI